MTTKTKVKAGSNGNGDALAEAASLIQQEAERQRRECLDKINALLDEYNLELSAIAVIRGGDTSTSVELRPKVQ